MAERLANKVVVITGAGRGIGRGIALRAAQEGACVVVGDYGGRFDAVAEPSHGPADEVVAEIAAAGGEAVASYEDVATAAGAERLVATALERFGRIDAMVCCAGIAVQKPLWELAEDEWDAVIRVHLKGHFVCTKAALPHLMAQGSGRIVTFSSSAALTAPLEGTSYATAKAGILGFTWSAARALQRHGITVNCIMPGGHTRLVDNLSGDWGLAFTYEQQAEMASESPEETVRRRDPANVAPAVVYLLSDAAAGITGQVFAAAGYQITRLDRPRSLHTISSDGPWDLDALFERFPAEFGDELRVRRMSWPPKPGA